MSQKYLLCLKYQKQDIFHIKYLPLLIKRRGEWLHFALQISIKLGLCVFSCQSYHFYGTEVWNLQNSAVKSFHVAWCKAIRRMWHLPNTIRSAATAVISDTIEVQLDKFYMSLNEESVRNGEQIRQCQPQ